MAEILAKPQVEDSISVTSTKHSDLNLTIDEISLSGSNQYEGISIGELSILKQLNINIVGIIKSDGKTDINPNSETILSIEDTILLIGNENNLNKFKDTLP